MLRPPLTLLQSTLQIQCKYLYMHAQYWRSCMIQVIEMPWLALYCVVIVVGALTV